MIRNLAAFWLDVLRPTRRHDDLRAHFDALAAAIPEIIPADPVLYEPERRRQRAELKAHLVREAAWERIGRFGDEDLAEWEREAGWVR